MRGGCYGHHTQAHRQKLSCCLSLQEDPGALAHPCHRAGTRAHAPAPCAQQCPQELLGTHSASAANWTTASSGAWLWLPTLQPPIGHSALWPHPALPLTAVWLRALGPPWDQATHSPLCGTESGLLQQPLSEMVSYNLQLGRSIAPPTGEGTEAERAWTQGTGRGEEVPRQRQASTASLGLGTAAPSPSVIPTSRQGGAGTLPP